MGIQGRQTIGMSKFAEHRLAELKLKQWLILSTADL